MNRWIVELLNRWIDESINLSSGIGHPSSVIRHPVIRHPGIPPSNTPPPHLPKKPGVKFSGSFGVRAKKLNPQTQKKISLNPGSGGIFSEEKTGFFPLGIWGRGFGAGRPNFKNSRGRENPGPPPKRGGRNPGKRPPGVKKTRLRAQIF